MKLIYCLAIILCPYGNMAQPIKPLNIGDEVPDIELTNVYNYPLSTIHLSDLKGKLVILDFWSTWCGACIESFPKMATLQKEFGDELQVLLINTYNGDSAGRVKPFFEKRKQRTGLGMELPYSLLQTSLAEYFPYKFIPHYVWIDKAGKVIATTSQLEVTHSNIKAAIENNNTAMHTKQDMLDFNPDVSLFVNGNGGTGNEYVYRSIFTHYIEGIGNATGLTRNDSGKIIRFYMFNASLGMLLRTAYSSQMKYSPGRIINELKNPSLFYPQNDGDTSFYKNRYCYEIDMAAATLDSIFKCIREDIARVFHVIVKNEQRLVKCLVLRATEKLHNSKSRGGEGIVSLEKSDLKKYIHNQPVSTLAAILNDLPAFKDVTVIDNTGIAYNIDLEFPQSLFDMDIPSLQKKLEAAGFVFTEEKRKLDVAVITDN